MTSLEAQGYLGKSMEGVIIQVRAQHEVLFALASEVNTIAQRFLLELAPRSTNAQEIIVAALYVRIVSNYQATILLVERGMRPEACTLARAMLEGLFTLAAISKQAALVRDFIYEDQALRRKLLNRYRMLRSIADVMPLPEDELNAIGAKLDADIQANRIRIKSTEEWAQVGGLHELYLTAYTVFSYAAHAKVRDLQNHLEFDKVGALRRFEWGPDTTDAPQILVATIEAILLSLRHTAELFGVELNRQVSDIHERLRAAAVFTSDVKDTGV